MPLRPDHIAVSCVTLAEGVLAIEAALGTSLTAGGQHAAMGTHNRLLGLGDLYLEVIAIDPAAPAPDRPRWFDLDRFSGPPRLTNWVAACDDLPAALALAPGGTGVPLSLSRGDFRWDMAVPADGCLPFGGAFPALIQWHGTAHPAQRLPDLGLRLERLTICHPDPDLRLALAGLCHDPRLVVDSGPFAMQTRIRTPHGVRDLN
jgi:Glyoxalase-like domain